MRLAEFFRVIGPLFAEQASARDVAKALYGPEPTLAHERLVRYERMARWRRAETLAGIFPRVRGWHARHAPAASAGHAEHHDRCAHTAEEAWHALATAYFAEAPWGSVKPLPNVAGFPDFLARRGAEHGLAAWVAELADLEWWVQAVRAAPDDPADPDTGPLRVAATVELRVYEHDLVEWIADLDAIAAEPPVVRRQVALLWRNSKGVACVRALDTAQLRLLALVRAGQPLTADAAASHGLRAEEVQRTGRTLRRAGALVGDAAAALAGLGPSLALAE